MWSSRREGEKSREGAFWSTGEWKKERKVFFPSVLSRRCSDSKEEEKEEEDGSPLSFISISLRFRTRAPVLRLPSRVLSSQRCCTIKTKERKKQSKEPMRLSLAALAQIGRLPTPPAAVLEAVSSETKVRDFFREVSA
jgi:hypothetical protein